MAIVLTLPSEGRAKKDLNVAHEVDLDVLCKFCTEEGFYGGVGIVVHGVINIDTHVN